MRLTIRNEYKDTLLRLGIEDIEGLLRKSEVQIIDDVDKSVVSSIVLERPHGQERIAIKRYDKPTLKRKLKDIFRSSKAVREWKVGNWLMEREIPAATPLAVAERRRLRILEDSFLICREIEGANKLRDYIYALKPPISAEARKEKREIMCSLARKLREVHDKGFFHGDLNTSHIMMQSGESRELVFYFVDFESSRLRRKLSLKYRIKDLARLNESMPPLVSRTDRFRFFQVYSHGLGLSRRERKKIMRRIEARTQTKKRPFSVLKLSGMRIIIRDDYREALSKLRLEDPGSLTRSSQAHILEGNGKATLVSLPIRRGENKETVVLKHHKYRRFLEKAKDVFRSGRAMREWKIANRLLQIGIATPLPLAVGERRRFRVVRDSFLITQEIPAAVNLGDYLAGPADEEKYQVMESLAKFIKRGHDRGFFFGDLNIRNILMEKTGDRKLYLYFIDFESSRFVRKIYPGGRIRELSRLYLSWPQPVTMDKWLRFFQAYIGRDRHLRERKDKYLWAIQRRIPKKRRKR